MIQWLFDRRNSHGFLPNLIKDETLEPNTPAWWDLALNPPFSLEFIFLKYCKLDKIPQTCTLVTDYITGTASAYYPINLNFYDPEIDYISYMDDYSRKRLIAGDFRLLIYYSEGDNPEPEIINSIEQMCTKHKLSPDSIRFAIGNYKLKNTKPFVFFPDGELYYRYLQILENNYVREQNTLKRDKKFTCLIRVDKAWRKIYGSYLYQLDVIKDGYFSYIGYKYKTSHTGLDDIDQWENFDDTLKQDVLSFELKTPIRCDDLSDEDHNNHKLVNHDYYQNAYFNFVVETHFDDDTIYLTEKTFKPILNLQPFIVIGNPGTLALLKDLGYKTFEDVIKETYDKQTDHRDRMSSLLKISFDLCRLSDKHHLRIQSIIRDVLEHNQKHFLAPKVNRINTFLRELEY
tara:strand:- start:335 stop:1540 length:1206 start_codon:yes stop_codon:yes gene_type:complete